MDNETSNSLNETPCLFQKYCSKDTVLIKVPKGRAIFMRDQPVAFVYHLHEGLVGAIYNTEEGHEISTALIVPSQFIMLAGFDDMYTNRHLSHFVEARAITPVVYCKVKREAVWDLMDDRLIRAQIFDSICHMVLNNFELTGIPLKRDIGKRITIVLNILAQSIGKYQDDGQIIISGITHNDIAVLANTTRSTVTRELKKLETDGVTVIHRRQIAISGPQTLLRHTYFH